MLAEFFNVLWKACGGQVAKATFLDTVSLPLKRKVMAVAAKLQGPGPGDDTSLPLLLLAAHRVWSLNPRFHELQGLSIVAGAMVATLEKCFEEAFLNRRHDLQLCLDPPPNSKLSYLYRRGAATTHADPLATSDAVVAPSTAITAQSPHAHAKHNILYLWQNCQTLLAAMAKYQTMCVACQS